MAQRSVRSACESGSYATFVKVSHRMGDQNLLSRAPCFGSYVTPLVPTAFTVVRTLSSFKEDWRQAGGRSQK
jgi:hypothetical protein